jgi:uncharacterized membrane protein (DUF4010 family)
LVDFVTEPFPTYEVAARIASSLGVGLLVGLEREWAQKEIGVRTFSIIALLGALTSLLGGPLVVTALIGAFLLVAFLNVQSLLRDRSLELTTSAALIVTLILGVLVGRGQFFTAVASAIAMTMLLAWKAELSRFAGGLAPEEIRSAVLLGLLSLVIHPLLPDRFLDPWALVNPRQAWVVVLVIAGLGFGNYWLLRLYGARGAYYAAFLGGLVNSTAAAAELTAQLGRSAASAALALALLLLTNVAMFARNLAILGIFAPLAVRDAAMSFALMTFGVLPWVWPRGRHAKLPSPQLQLSSPLSLRHVLGFGAVFVALAAAGTLVERHVGGVGFLALSIVGGLISSASTTASAASLAANGTIANETAAMAVVLTSMASALASLPVVYVQTRGVRLFRTLATSTGVIVVLGLSVFAIRQAWAGW